MKLTFLGAGAFGTALSNIAKENGHDVRFYDPIKFPDTTLATAVKDADLAIYTAPSNKYAEILPDLPKNLPLICASKGFLSLSPFSEFTDFSALGGAGFADDLAKNTKNFTFTTSSTLAETIFSTEEIHLEYTPDTLGIMLCGAMKNIYAVGAGLYSKDGASVEMPYLEKAAAEIQIILSANGADDNTLQLSCGIPDLLISCTKNSRNFRFGYAIKSGQTPENTTIEGVTVINSIADFPDFIVPETAVIFQDIITRIKNNVTK